jgi:hypothetical protein
VRQCGLVLVELQLVAWWGGWPKVVAGHLALLVLPPSWAVAAQEYVSQFAGVLVVPWETWQEGAVPCQWGEAARGALLLGAPWSGAALTLILPPPQVEQQVIWGQQGLSVLLC